MIEYGEGCLALNEQAIRELIEMMGGEHVVAVALELAGYDGEQGAAA